MKARAVANAVAETVRYVWSTALLLFSLSTIIWGLLNSQSSFYPSVAPAGGIVLLPIFLVLLGTMEGTMICLTQMRKVDPSTYRMTHPYAFATAMYAFKGDGMERFLNGRQVFVVALGFQLAKLTTINSLPEMPNFIQQLLASGMLGSFIVCILGQISFQVFAAKYPLRVLNIPGLHYIVRLCHAVEFTGITFACRAVCRLIVWLARSNFLSSKGESQQQQQQQQQQPASLVAAGEQKCTFFEAALDGDEAKILAAGDDAPLAYGSGDSSVAFASPTLLAKTVHAAGLEPLPFLLPEDHEHYVAPYVAAMAAHVSVQKLQSIIATRKQEGEDEDEAAAIESAASPVSNSLSLEDGVVSSSKRMTTMQQWGMNVWSAFRYLWSLGLLVFSLVMCTWGIFTNEHTFYPDEIPSGLVFVLLFVFLAILGLMEGAMISVTQLRRLPSESYMHTHKRAYLNVQLATGPHVLERFLMGRQLVVIVLVFVLSRITTFNNISTPGATAANNIAMSIGQTGLLGAFIVLIFGNLTPQVMAAEFPLQFLNGLHVLAAMYLGLAIQWVGLPHACFAVVRTVSTILRAPWEGEPPPAATLAIAAAAAAATATAISADDSSEELIAMKSLSAKPIAAGSAATVAAAYAELLINESLAVDLDDQLDPATFVLLRTRGNAAYQHALKQPAPTGRPSLPQLAASILAAGEAIPDFAVGAASAHYVPPHIAACKSIVLDSKLRAALNMPSLTVSQLLDPSNSAHLQV